MNFLQRLHWFSRPLPKKMQNFYEVRCFLSQVATEEKAMNDNILNKKQKRPRKHLSPILKEELDVGGLELRQFFKNGALESLDKYSLKHRLANLKKMGFEKEDIKSELSILLVPEEEISARKAILEECGITKITATLLSQYEVVVRKRIGLFKASGHIPQEMNVPENILSYSGAEIPAPNFHFLRKSRFLSTTATADAIALGDLHKYTVLHYLAWFFEDSDVFKSRRLFKPKSLRHIIKAFDALQSLDLQKKQLARCLYLSHCDPDKLDDMLRWYPKIGGKETTKIIQKHPKIALLSSSDVHAVLQFVKDFGLNAEAVGAYPAILEMKEDALRQGLSLLKSLPDLWALRHSDGILRLLPQKNLISKLQYFKSLPRRVVPSISLLLSNNAAIHRSLLRNTPRSHVADFLRFLAVELSTNVHEVKAVLSRHPQWRLGSAKVMSETLSFLRSRGFRDRDILENGQILMYPRSFVESVLEEKVAGVSSTKEVPKISSRDLALCLYFIEKQHGFTGMGILEGSELTGNVQIDVRERCRAKPCQRDCGTNPLCALRLHLNHSVNRQEKDGQSV